MKASSLACGTAVLFALAGMIWGMVMGATGDHSTFPAHAHLNLLGWVTLFLFGLYYHQHPAIAARASARWQVATWIVATAAMAVGVGLAHSGREAVGEPIAIVSSLVLTADMIFFGWLLLGRRSHASAIGYATTD